jgi:hypothetical protein
LRRAEPRGCYADIKNVEPSPYLPVPKMKPNKDLKLADLMYGHEGRFICNLSGRFDPEKYSQAPPIQICEMKCGCWVVADGNNRIGLILRKHPEATLADIPNNLLVTAQFGEWDGELMDWWNPCPKSFRFAMRKLDNHMPTPRDAIYGFIERSNDGRFYASTMSVKEMPFISATGRTAKGAERRLEQKLRNRLKREYVTILLTPVNPLEKHRCSARRAV